MRNAWQFSAATAAIAFATAFGTASAQSIDEPNDATTGATAPVEQTAPAQGPGMKGYLSRKWHSDRSSSEQAEIDAGNMPAPNKNAQAWMKNQPAGQMPMPADEPSSQDNSQPRQQP